jgi:hypothetical protein
MKRACHDADEYDAFTKWRRYYNWGPGRLKAIKRRASKRDRRQAQADIRRERASG